MKKRYYLYRRGNRYYAEDSQTGCRESLHTTDKRQASELVRVKNEAAGRGGFNLALARVYLAEADPKLSERTWSMLMDEFSAHGREPTRERKRRGMQNPLFNSIRSKCLIETTADDLRAILAAGGVFTRHCLRCLHNLAVGLGWLPWPIIPPKLWPPNVPKPKRGITREEHVRIILHERNPERRAFYELLWETGAAQSDAAKLTAEDIDWRRRTLTYCRMKTGEWASLSIGPRFEKLLRSLPTEGLLFPHIALMRDCWRSSEFRRRCKLLGIDGVSLHSYRYSFAERAKALGYPQRWAQNALGHNSRAVHQAYARRGVGVCPSLEDYEQASSPQIEVPEISPETKLHDNRN